MSFTYDPNFEQPVKKYVQQPSTLQYNTFLNRALVEATEAAFNASNSQLIKNTKVAVPYSQDQYNLPTVLISYDQTSNINAGVGQEEYLPSPYSGDGLNPSQYLKYYQRIYKGTVSFQMYAQSSTDLIVLKDTVIEILTTTDATKWGNAFIQRMYFFLNKTPYGFWNYPILNTDIVTGGQMTQSSLPWAPSDKLAYRSNYRIPIWGTYYSATPSKANSIPWGIIEEVDLTIDFEDTNGNTVKTGPFIFQNIEYPSGGLYPSSDLFPGTQR